MVYIYILKLKEDKYYVGKTSNPDFRITNHFDSKGSKWTTKYKPIQIEEIIPNCDDYDEDKYTNIYMNKYGIDNVRGGSYCEIKLSKQSVDHLKRVSNGANDRCYICNKEGHFANKCKLKPKPKTKPSKPKKIPTCFKCGEVGHYSTRCKVKVEKDTDEYDFCD